MLAANLNASGQAALDETSGFISYFSEANLVYTLLDSLVKTLDRGEVSSSGPAALTTQQQRDLDKICLTLDIYQEQPHLLDAHLERLITPILSGIRKHIGNAFGNGVEVRGHKTVVKFLSHEATDLEPTLDFLTAAAYDSPEGGSLWETRYVGFLWMSLICMIPFDLKRIDSAVGTGKTSLVERISALCKPYLSAVSKEYESAAILMMRLLTRRDTVNVHLPGFLEWAISEALATDDIFKLRGILFTLAVVYKSGSRATLLPTLDTNNMLLRKLLGKLSQRIGLCYMKPKTAAWRYQRGNRSLVTNLAQASGTSTSQAAVNERTDMEEDEEEEDVPEDVEEVVGILLNGLRDKDTIVRWSAAKGVGRIANRLPRDFAQEVVASVLSLLEEDTFENPDIGEVDFSQVSDSTWHGACLALAELARRGLLLPERLEEVVPWIIRALKFDQRRGAHSVGVHVRDAACYVCWSFARAYAPEVVKPFVADLARTLAVISVADREINVRRAASAAFQENVGRQGVFPHGIDIVTLADYFAVGNRSTSYLDVAVEISKFGEYRHPVFHHVASVSAVHWDRAMRELAATALGKLTKIDVEYMVGNVLRKLIPQASSEDLNVRHGSMLAIGEICLAWAEVKREGESGKFWTDEEYENVIVPISTTLVTLSRTHLDGFGSDQTRTAACHLITCIASTTSWPRDIPSIPAFRPTLWEVVNDSLDRREANVQEVAAVAVSALGKWGGVDDRIVLGWLEGVKVECANVYRRRGCALALGRLCKRVLHTWVARILESLAEACVVQEEKTKNDAEARRNAVEAVVNVICVFGTDYRQVIPRPLFSRTLTVLSDGLEDYSTDSRGDVGSWVREACLRALERIVDLDFGAQGDGERYVTPGTVERFLAALCRQSVEKIDRMRECAGGILERVVWEKGVEEELVKGLREVLGRDAQINWNNPAEVFPRMVKVLELEAYRREVLVGLVVSVGGLTESLVRHSSSSLIDFLGMLPDSSTPSTSFSITTFFDELADLFTRRAKQDRVTIPLLEVLDVLFGSGSVGRCVDAESGGVVVKKLFEAVKVEVAKSKDVKKVVAGIRVFCGFASLPKSHASSAVEVDRIRKRAMKSVVMYLAHPYPKVRRAASENLYVVITTLGMDLEEEGDGEEVNMVDTTEIEEVLLGTDWDAPVAGLKAVRDRVGVLVDGL
ncbi:hypothetical protein HDV00_002086 [Rhizophlyctis rosea]|nr:hypothetical protein HDV00_002086 [Rhizophlyctis rosea]